LRVDFFRSDAALLRAYCVGDADAFESLYRRHNDGLFNFLLRHTLRWAVAEEIAQDAWIVVIDKASEFKPEKAKFRTWLFRIARNKAVDSLRRPLNQVYSLSESSEQLADDFHSVENEYLLNQLLEALELLPAEQRETFILQQEGFSLKEIAAITQVGVETVKSRLRYAKLATRRQLEQSA